MTPVYILLGISDILSCSNHLTPLVGIVDLSLNSKCAHSPSSQNRSTSSSAAIIASIMSPRPTFDLYIANGKREFDDFPVHWWLITIEGNRSDNRCTYYHSTDGDGKFLMDYEVKIQHGKRFDSWGIGTMRKLGVIHEEDINILEFISLTTPPQRCQLWVCASEGYRAAWLCQKRYGSILGG